MSYGNFYGAGAYANVGLETSVASASPLGLVVLLYDGAIQALANARQCVSTGDIAGKARNVAKAVDIINKGLNASLDPVIGGKLAFDLKSLYEYMCRRLVVANIKNDPEALDEVRGLLMQLREAWVTIHEHPERQLPQAANRLNRSTKA
jgi:flagellar protein FliS